VGHKGDCEDECINKSQRHFSLMYVNRQQHEPARKIKIDVQDPRQSRSPIREGLGDAASNSPEKQRRGQFKGARVLSSGSWH